LACCAEAFRDLAGGSVRRPGELLDFVVCHPGYRPGDTDGGHRGLRRAQDRRRQAADTDHAFLIVDGISMRTHVFQFITKLLRRSDRVRRIGLENKRGDDSFPLLGRQVCQYRFA